MKFSRVKVFLSFGFLAIIAMAVLLIERSDSGEIELKLKHNNSDIINSGKEIYATNCASCHGVDLGGQPDWRTRKENGALPAPPHDETGHTWHHSDALLIDLTKRGPKSIAGPDYITDMPAYDSILSDNEIIAVLSYIKSTWPEKIRKRHDGLK